MSFLPYQSNRKQSMNYGCIVENEETNEVFNPFSLYSLIISHHHFSLNYLFNIKSMIPPFSGPSLRWKAEHICEWHHKLRYIPLQPRYLPAHRHRLSEESAGHVVVSWSSFFEGICPCVSVPFILFLWFSSFDLFPPSHDFCFLTQSSDIHMMGKLVRLGCTA